VPSSAGAGRVRQTSAEPEAAAQAGENENGFGDVLSKLQRKDGRQGEPVSGRARLGERAHLQLGDVEAQLGPQKDGGDDLGLDALADGLGGSDQSLDTAPQSDVPADQPQGADAAIVNNLAAMVAVNAAPPSATTESAPLANPHANRQAADPMTAAKAMLEAKSANTKSPAGASAKTGNQPEHVDTDPALARLATTSASIDTEKTDKSRRSAQATDVSSAQFPDDAAPEPQPANVNASAERPKANVLRQETHFRPVASTAASAPTSHAADASSGGVEMSLAEPATISPAGTTVLSGSGLSGTTPPSQQIADHIFAEAATATDRAGTVPDQVSAKATLRVLHIQLQPADLGAVTVRMELRDAELTLHVEADRRETADLIRNDQDALSKLLRSAGYSVDSGSIRVAEPDRTLATQSTSQQGTQTNLQSFSQSGSGASERQGHAHRGNTGANGGDASPQSSRNDTNETTDSRTGRGLYV